MATWFTHMRIAEHFMNIDDHLNCVDFLVGNIAPDCGVPNENWSKFTPDKNITHWRLDGEKIDAENFKDAHVVRNENGFSFSVFHTTFSKIKEFDNDYLGFFSKEAFTKRIHHITNNYLTESTHNVGEFAIKYKLNLDLFVDDAIMFLQEVYNTV